MWLWPLIEAHEQFYSAFRQLGYDDVRADRAAGLVTLLCILTAVWLGIELAIHF